MPTRYLVHAFTPAPRWLDIWNAMYRKLEPRGVEILREAGFYEKSDIEAPDQVAGRELRGEERAAIERIATALTIAADAAHQTSPGLIAAWLQKVADHPELFRSKQLPPEVHWAIASCYQRDNEAPGTHLQDVWGRRRVHFEAKARRASNRRVSRAARLAAECLHRPRGRPLNIANEILAEYLAEVFRSFGGRIVRRNVPIDRKGGGIRFAECGPFCLFIKGVIGPLEEHLKEHGLPPVTSESIERIASERFAGGHHPARPFSPTDFHERLPPILATIPSLHVTSHGLRNRRGE